MIRAYAPSDLDRVRELLVAEGWGARAEDAERLRRIIEHATSAVVAEVDGRVVGFGRCLTDGVSNGYISMLVVDPEHRRRGIGRALVEALIPDDPTLSWVLRAGRTGSEKFWEAMGFRKSEIAYERPRRG